MFVIGLTGGIASGKSAVAQILSELGAVVIDADKIGHDAFLPHTDIWEQLVNEFGISILNQNEEIDRAKLAEKVFDDPKSLKKLNSIMHPLMYKIVEEKLEDLRSRATKVAVLEATLLIEANWNDLVDEIWVVVAHEETVMQRILINRNITEQQARARIKSQMPIYEKAQHGDVVIENDAGFDELKRNVEKLWKQRVTKN